MIEEFVKLIPKSILHESGAAFWSGRRAFSEPSDLYILGTNPGGSDIGDIPVDASNAALTSIGRNMNFVLNEGPCGWSYYKDKNRTSRFERGVLHLFKRLELNPREVPASEVVFLRSPNQKELKGRFEQLAEQCWPFHQAVIDRLGVKVIVCIGKRAGEFVRRRLKAQSQTDEFVEKNKRQWESLSHRNENGIIVVTLTHASQASWTSPASDPTTLVKRALIRTDTKHRKMYMERRLKFKPIRIKGEMISDTVIRDREDRV